MAAQQVWNAASAHLAVVEEETQGGDDASQTAPAEHDTKRQNTHRFREFGLVDHREPQFLLRSREGSGYLR